MTAAMLLLVFTLVEAPDAGWTSLRTLGSLATVAVILAAFVARERTAAEPLIRLGILRSSSLVRANLGAMSLFGGWVGFQFVLTLYLQQLRGWSALETGLAILPAGMLVPIASPRMAWLIASHSHGATLIASSPSAAPERVRLIWKLSKLSAKPFCVRSRSISNTANCTGVTSNCVSSDRITSPAWKISGTSSDMTWIAGNCARSPPDCGSHARVA